MLGRKSFAVNDCLNSGVHVHHRMLFQAFAAATFTCCFFELGLSPFSFVFSNRQVALLCWDRVTWWLKNIKFLHLQKALFRIIIHLHCGTPSYQFCLVWIINKHQWTCSTGRRVHAITQPPPCLTHDLGAVPYLLHTFFLPIILL